MTNPMPSTPPPSPMPAAPAPAPTSVPAPNITRVLLKLHYLLWTRSLKSNKSAMIMNIFIALYALIGLTVFGITMGVDLSAGRYASLAGAVGIGTAAYIMIAIMIPSGEGQLSPESFSALPLTVRQLMPSFFLVQVLQIRGFMAVLCTTVTAIIAAIAIAGSAGIIAVVVLVVAMVLSLLLVIVVAESLAMAMSGSANQSSSSKNKQIYVAFGAFIVAWLAYSSIFNGSDNSLDLVRYGNILQWTPLASAAGFAAFAAAGQWLSALICLLITVATIAAGGYVWWHFTHKRLVAPLGTGGVAGAGRRRKARAAGQQSLLLPGLPYTPLVAVYSRALRYLIRDARQTIMMVMPLVLLFYFAVMGFRDNPFMFYVLPIIIGLLSGTNAVNDYGFDGPSNWLHLSSGVAAKDVVRGRHWASITPAILINLVSYILVLVLNFSHVMVLCVIAGMGAAITACGISLFLSVRNPYPTAKPGTNPWQDRSGFSVSAFISAFAGIFLAWIPMLPGILGLTYGYKNDMIAVEIIGVILILAVPIAAYLLVMRYAIRYLDNHYPEIFAKVRSYV